MKKTYSYKQIPGRSSYDGMMRRCYSKTFKHYGDYGGRGIIVCDRWKGSFKNFIDDMGLRPEGCSVDRINNDGNYEPSNCRWATRQEQQNNTRQNHLVTVDGETKNITQWAKDKGVGEHLIRNRLSMGWTEKDAVTKPKQQACNGFAVPCHPRARLM